MTTNVILESRFDAMLIALLLNAEIQSFDLYFLAGDPVSAVDSSERTSLAIGTRLEVEVQWLGRPLSSIYSTARTILAVRREPVALVLNADTTDPAAVSTRRQEVEEVIGEAASRAPFRWLLAVPALQSLLFSRPDLLTRTFGKGMFALDRVLDIGRFSPREAYRLLDPNGSEEATFGRLLEALSAEDLAALRKEPPVRELIAFVTEIGSPVVSPPTLVAL
jgi:hypothetical protein